MKKQQVSQGLQCFSSNGTVEKQIITFDLIKTIFDRKRIFLEHEKPSNEKNVTQP